MEVGIHEIHTGHLLLGMHDRDDVLQCFHLEWSLSHIEVEELQVHLFWVLGNRCCRTQPSPCLEGLVPQPLL